MTRNTSGKPPALAASDGTTGVYSISTAADLSGMSVQALRLYERKGLLHPARTTGGTRPVGVVVRARLPFRVFVLSGPGDGSRLVIDIAHQCWVVREALFRTDF